MPRALMIGASGGLGRAMTEEFLVRGWHVVGTVLEPGSLDEIIDDRLSVVELDTTDWQGVDAFRDKLAGSVFDLLMINAGIKGPSTVPIGEADPDAFTELMLVNVLAPLRLADRYVDLVTPAGTVAVMSSGMGSISLNTFGTWEAYRISKAALNMGLASIAARRADGRTYIAANPGWVRAGMGGDDAILSIEESIPKLVDMLERRAGEGRLLFVDYQDRDLPW